MTPPTGLTKDAGWQIGVSRTLPFPGEQVWRFLTAPEGLALWLGGEARIEPRRGAPYTLGDGTTGEVRGHQEGSRLRLTHRPPGAERETTVQFTVTSRGGSCVLVFHQERLAGAAEREDRRRHWLSVMDAVAEALSGPR
ncbi:SRPBCC family protein [Streptomyces albidus (ex Kaewkla and Franco 2022)]|uniref:SRPBCC family protein n=1 Tax=Streptomyces albidus (ex Kaewkla and Franco 2022) TaxID=722709 RepID=UPI0015EED1F6|nr:SRPBCC domain-containing protein [Streptomyces albidus (ex Kaewkla and Franco 2022)]